MLNMYVDREEINGVSKSTVKKIDEDGEILAEFDNVKGKISFDILETRIGQPITIHYNDGESSKELKIKTVKDGVINFDKFEG